MTMTKKKSSASKSSTNQSIVDSSPGTETSPETTSKIELDAQAETGSKANSETKAKADADAKAKADAKASVLTKSISVRSKSKHGFRRAGFAFGPEPKIITLNNLDDAKLKALNNEPNLIVEDVE
jgi:hypothetical protein